MLSWEEFLKTAFPHHAILLTSTFFEDESLSFSEFSEIANVYCGIHLGNDWEQASGHPDVIIIDRERKILRLEDVEAIHKNAHYPPLQAKRRLFFIDFCERLNVNSANSLLKIIEEPPTNALFLLTTGHFENVIPTIASRCQKIRIAFERPAKEKPSLEGEDETWLKKMLLNTPAFNANTFSEIIKKSDSLSRSYQAEQIMDVLAKYISCAMQERGNDFFPTARFLMAELQKWKKDFLIILAVGLGSLSFLGF